LVLMVYRLAIVTLSDSEGSRFHTDEMLHFAQHDTKMAPTLSPIQLGETIKGGNALKWQAGMPALLTLIGRGDMINVLQDVNAVVGVTGCFAGDGEGQVMASALPGDFDETMLSNVGRTVAQTLAGLELTRRRKVDDLDLVYREGRLVVKNLRPGCLVILCVPTINVPLLNLTANVAVRKLRELLKEQARPIPQAKPAAPPTPSNGLEAMANFVESLIEELEKRGVGREVMLKAIRHRVSRLQTHHPCLALVRVVGDKVDLSALQMATFGDEEIGAALGALIQGICWSAIGILGAEEARAGYDQVYESFHHQNAIVIERLGLGEILANAASVKAEPRLAGVEMTW
jgi:predicted regulator of Ras-like GTPase activity (Roadblock/LC7/MglB family)